MILLDTNALLWFDSGQRRARPLTRFAGHLYVSPATMLELEYLLETGRLELRRGARFATFLRDERWMVDDPPSLSWFTKATELPWTRDPFDRLLVAHARLRRWRLATADGSLLERLSPDEALEI